MRVCALYGECARFSTRNADQLKDRDQAPVLSPEQTAGDGLEELAACVERARRAGFRQAWAKGRGLLIAWAIRWAIESQRKVQRYPQVQCGRVGSGPGAFVQRGLRRAPNQRPAAHGWAPPDREASQGADWQADQQTHPKKCTPDADANASGNISDLRYTNPNSPLSRFRLCGHEAWAQRPPVRTIHAMRTDDLDFNLPRELIATVPASKRDGSRLLVVQRSDPSRIEHRSFADLPGLLCPKDVLVFNRSRVVPARLVGENIETGGKVSGLYLMDGPDPGTWIVLLKAKRTRPGRRVMLHSVDGTQTGVVLELLVRADEHGPGAWTVAVEDQHHRECPIETMALLGRAGLTPLPPYILSERAARNETHTEEADRDRYQTVYAGDADAGSVAAPTAGLHFTESVFADLKSRDVRTSEVVLHVGAGTFKPVETETLTEHPMHSEWCSLGPSAGAFAQGKPESGRVLAVGSTSARTLESYAQLEGSLPADLETRILISPGYRWRWVDGMVTNFHLPRSTLLAMVASMLEIPGEVDGVERVQEIYAAAIREKYRFYSYGDAMVILP